MKKIKNAIQVYFQQKIVGDGSLFADVMLASNAGNFQHTYDNMWLITWYHEGGRLGFELLPDPIPDSAIQSWKKGGLRMSFALEEKQETVIPKGGKTPK
jgi:hypothetical protein